MSNGIKSYTEISRGSGATYKERVVLRSDVYRYLDKGWRITRFAKVCPDKIYDKWKNAIDAIDAMDNLQKLSPEELSLKLMAEWFDSVSKEEFLEEFNSLGNHYSGITIGEFLNQNKDLESNFSIKLKFLILQLYF